jgi:hypothetical protein
MPAGGCSSGEPVRERPGPTVIGLTSPSVLRDLRADKS